MEINFSMILHEFKRKREFISSFSTPFRKKLQLTSGGGGPWKMIITKVINVFISSFRISKATQYYIP